MMESKRINDEMLKDVVGGAIISIETHPGTNAIVREKPDINSKQVVSLGNQTKVNWTGERVKNTMDGGVWYKIDDPYEGWILECYLAN